ncbi:hypothetical protein D3C72_1994680 [compost metagenome]
MQVQTFLGRLVVIGRDQQAGIGAHILGRARQFDRLARGVAAGTGDHRDAPGDLIDHPSDHFDMFGHFQRGRLAGGPDRDDGVGALLQVEIHQFAQAVPIETTLCIHGRDQCHHTARNHATTPAGKRER